MKHTNTTRSSIFNELKPGLDRRLLVSAVLVCTVIASSASWAAKGGKGGGGGGDGAETGHVIMVATGASGTNFVVDAFQDCEERLAADDTSYLCNKSGTDHDLAIGNFLRNRVYPNGSKGANCFGLVGATYRVSIGVDKNKDGSAETVFWFHAFKDDRKTDVLYALVVNDPRGWSGGPFPPAVGGTTSMGVLHEDAEISWDLGASNKQQERNACVDSGTFTVTGSDFIKMEFTRDD